VTAKKTANLCDYDVTELIAVLGKLLVTPIKSIHLEAHDSVAAEDGDK
jgi:hypothetical protein